MRESLEAAQRVVGVGGARRGRDVTVHPIGIGPVSLDGDRVEAELVDQSPGETGALSVELVRPVRRFADHDDVPVPNQFEQRVVVAGRTGQGVRHSIERPK